jgi:hypothetical protein
MFSDIVTSRTARIHSSLKYLHAEIDYDVTRILEYSFGINSILRAVCAANKLDLWQVPYEAKYSEPHSISDAMTSLGLAACAVNNDKDSYAAALKTNSAIVTLCSRELLNDECQSIDDENHVVAVVITGIDEHHISCHVVDETGGEAACVAVKCMPSFGTSWIALRDQTHFSNGDQQWI